MAITHALIGLAFAMAWFAFSCGTAELVHTYFGHLSLRVQSVIATTIAAAVLAIIIVLAV